jgi:hypothetical protein
MGEQERMEEEEEGWEEEEDIGAAGTRCKQEHDEAKGRRKKFAGLKSPLSLPLAR